MAYDRKQFKGLITRTLKEINLFSSSAVNLLLGTAAVESRFGSFLRQQGSGPALGAFQIEPATFSWLQSKYAKRFPYIKDKKAEELEWDLKLSIIIARLRYLVVPYPLPPSDDLPSLAAYWKTHYNTFLGAGTTEHFIKAYNYYAK